LSILGRELSAIGVFVLEPWIDRGKTVPLAVMRRGHQNVSAIAKHCSGVDFTANSADLFHQMGAERGSGARGIDGIFPISNYSRPTLLRNTLLKWADCQP